MDSLHTTSDATFWSFGEDQTVIWSEVADSVQPALESDFDWGLGGPVTVSTISRI